MTAYVVELRAPKKGERYVAEFDYVSTASMNFENAHPVIIAEVPDDCVVVDAFTVSVAADLCKTANHHATAGNLRAALDSQKTAEVAAKTCREAISDAEAQGCEWRTTTRLLADAIDRLNARLDAIGKGAKS